MSPLAAYEKRKEYIKRGFNRNLIGGKRPMRGVQRLGHLTLGQRVWAESKALTDYHNRINKKS